jgi:hypothetical protein
VKLIELRNHIVAKHGSAKTGPLCELIVNTARDPKIKWDRCVNPECI